MNIRAQYSESVRIMQRARLRRLEFQYAVQGRAARARALALQAAVRSGEKQAEEGDGQLVPSAETNCRVLGLMKTAVQLRRGRMRTLEQSLNDYASLLGMAKSTVAACLHWLERVGVIVRVRRGGLAVVDGVKRTMNRTTKVFLSEVGEVLLGVGLLGRLRRYAKRHARRVRAVEQKFVPRVTEQALPPQPEPQPDDDERARGLANVRWILEGVLG